MKLNSATMSMLALASVLIGADGWRQVDEGGFRFDVPANWEKKEVQGIDSLVGHYEGPDGRLEFDGFGYYSAFHSRNAIAAMKAKETNPKLLEPGEEIWRIDGHLASFRSSPREASIYIYNDEDRWTLSMRITFAIEDFLPTARRILSSVKIKQKP
ncbi:MAG: hypothetical protein JNJ70_07710 [Verrucomicrobiales bacterium]|nr:hypothetical protein [Verrucomicrobiales bacterium]